MVSDNSYPRIRDETLAHICSLIDPVLGLGEHTKSIPPENMIIIDERHGLPCQGKGINLMKIFFNGNVPVKCVYKQISGDRALSIMKLITDDLVPVEVIHENFTQDEWDFMYMAVCPHDEIPVKYNSWVKNRLVNLGLLKPKLGNSCAITKKCPTPYTLNKDISPTTNIEDGF